MKYAVVQYPGTDSQEVIAWFDRLDQAQTYVAVNADDGYPLDIMKLDRDGCLTTEF